MTHAPAVRRGIESRARLLRRSEMAKRKGTKRKGNKKKELDTENKKIARRGSGNPKGRRWK